MFSMDVLIVSSFSYELTVSVRVGERTVRYFPCDQWLEKDEGGGKIRRQLMATKKSTDKPEGMLCLRLLWLNLN